MSSFEHQKQMFTLMDKKIFTSLHLKRLPMGTCLITNTERVTTGPRVYCGISYTSLGLTYIGWDKISPVFRVSNQVRLKLASSATEISKNTEICELKVWILYFPGRNLQRHCWITQICRLVCTLIFTFYKSDLLS